MSRREIDIVRGDDWGVLEDPTPADPDDPSGLDRLGFHGEKEQALFEMFREIIREILSQAPREIADALPPRLPLYGQANMGMAGITAITHYGPRNADPRKLRTFLGISIGCKPEEMRHHRSYFAHEILHMTVNPGVSSETGIAECFVNALEKRHFRDPSKLNMQEGWDADALMGTSGLRSNDFASVDVCPEFMSARYLTATHALQYLTAEQIWRVCASLVSEARNTGLNPTFGAVRDALTGEDAENGERVLRTLPFRGMEPGVQQYLFPKGRDLAFAYTFSVAENPEYERYAMDYRRRIQFICRSHPGNKRMEFRGSALHRPIVSERNPMLPSETFGFAHLAKLLEQTTQGTMRANGVEEILCEINRWKFRLRPPRIG